MTRPSGITCGGCSTPVSAYLKACPWCQAAIDSVDTADAPGTVVDELGQILDWLDTSESALPSAVSWRLGAKLVFAALFTTAVGAYLTTVGMTGLRSIAAVAICGLLIAALLSASHWKTWRARNRLTAEEAAAFFFGSLEIGESNRALTALTDHPQATKRHEDLDRIWRAVNPQGFATYATTRVHMGHVERIRDGVSLIAVSVLLKRQTGASLPGLGSYYRTESASFHLRKLVIRRRGRWYIVNGLPTDSLDQKLAERLRSSP